MPTVTKPTGDQDGGGNDDVQDGFLDHGGDEEKSVLHYQCK